MIEEIVILSAAEDDLLKTYFFYDEWEKGEDFHEEVSRRLEQIKHFPNSGRTIQGEFQKLNLKRFPYTIVYRVHGLRAFVIGLFPLRINPDEILKRLK